MSILRRTGLWGAATALVLTSVTPAMAGWGGGFGGGWNSWGGSSWGGGGWGRRRHRGDDTGEVLAGVLIGAVLVGAIASSSKQRRARAGRDVDYPERRTGDDSYPQRNGDTGRYGDRRGSISSENAAVDACAVAAEERAGRMASVREISNVRGSSDGWDVEGIIENRDNWRDRAGERHRFTCSVRFGSVDSVYVESGSVAYAD